MSNADIAEVVGAANSGEIQLAQLALEKSTNQAVQRYAQQMIADHSSANSQVAALMQRLGLSGTGALAETGGAATSQPAPSAGMMGAASAQGNAAVHNATPPPPPVTSATTGNAADVHTEAPKPAPVTAATTGDGVRVSGSATPTSNAATPPATAGSETASKAPVRNATPPPPPVTSATTGNAADVHTEAPRPAPVTAATTGDGVNVRGAATTVAPNGNGQALASAAPTELSVAAIQAATARELAALSGLAGASFDRAYLAYQVTLHQWLLQSMASSLVPSARDSGLKDLLTAMRPKVQAHLDAARQLQSTPGS